MSICPVTQQETPSISSRRPLPYSFRKLRLTPAQPYSSPTLSLAFKIGGRLHPTIPVLCGVAQHSLGLSCTVALITLTKTTKGSLCQGGAHSKRLRRKLGFESKLQHCQRPQALVPRCALFHGTPMLIRLLTWAFSPTASLPLQRLGSERITHFA